MKRTKIMAEFEAAGRRLSALNETHRYASSQDVDLLDRVRAEIVNLQGLEGELLNQVSRPGLGSDATALSGAK
jgi:hypothetical protein